jgi:predicted DsbA family dithiol-disulfide isomerase
MDTPQPPSAAIAIDVVSDVVCPWCYLGKRRLERALTLVPEIAVAIRWWPFQLDGTIPPEGMDRKEYLRRKFGDPRRVDAVHERLVEFGRHEGIDFHFERITRAPNTLDAHRLTRWVPEARQDEAVEHLFRANFSEGRNVGDHAVLAAIGGDLGLDPEETQARLAGEDDRAEVTAEIENAYRIGVTGVPCFIIDRRYAVMGAEAPETSAEAIRRANGARQSATA